MERVGRWFQELVYLCLQNLKLTVMMRLLTFFLCCWISSSVWAADRVVCVTRDRAEAPQGAVIASTLQKGIVLAGKYKQKGDDVTLLVAGGTYRLDKTLEMTARELGLTAGSLVVRPLDGAKVIFYGGVEIPAQYIEQAPASESRIRPEMRGKIVKVDLRKAGITSLGELRNSGFSRPAVPAWTEVFVNDQVQKLSRWPNDTMALMGEVVETGSIPRNGEMDNRGGTFRYFGDRPSQWKSGDPKWIAGYFAWGYADDMVRIAQIDTTDKTIKLDEAVMYGLISGADYNRWYVVNLLEEVDVPGEYYIDYPNMTLWLYPSEKIEKLSLSLLAEPMLALEGVKNVEVQHIDFECSRGMGVYMERTENVILRGCRFHNLGATAVCIGKGVKPYDQYAHTGETNIPVSRMIGNLAQYIYKNPVFDREAGRNNGIVDCVIEEVGAGGINMGGGNRITLEPGGNYVQNCRISRYNRVEKSYRPAIQLTGAGNRVSNCEIFDAPSSAILIQGNDHLVEYCDIHNVCNEIDDLGAVYYGRDQSEQGNKLMFNYVHDLSAKHRVTGFYHDDGACGMYVYGNILYKAGLQPVLLGGGSDNHYKNNIFIGTPYGLYVDNRLENWAKGTIDIIKERLEMVNYESGPFKEKYPWAANYVSEGIATPKRNVAERNLFYDISKLLICPGERPYERAYMEMDDNWITWSGKGFDEPGFVDEKNGNWNLKPDAAIFKYIPGFEAIPVDKIGCTLPK